MYLTKLIIMVNISLFTIYQTQTPCGFLFVGTAFSNCLGDPIIFLVLPAFMGPKHKYLIYNHFLKNYKKKFTF